jgi:hypothetical protein
VGVLVKRNLEKILRVAGKETRASYLLRRMLYPSWRLLRVREMLK